MAEAMRAKLTETERRAFAGFLPAAFHFKGMGIVAIHHYPLYRLRGHECGPSYDRPITEEERSLFNDVVRLCGVLVNRGLVLRARQDDNQPLPEAGHCVWIKNYWGWMPSDAWKLDSDGLLVHRNFQ
ncbi:hypothetical protein LXA43DRAFT_1123958 [Ganoderma leucocontextum]|nr:hypothetical protein LXA43DRAFT_1123958 [Ganoderma leucocontextum]